MDRGVVQRRGSSTTSFSSRSIDGNAHLGTVNKLADLAPYVSGVKVVGVVIAKGEIRRSTRTSGGKKDGTRGQMGLQKGFEDFHFFG
jgi:hypothetical protein